MAYVTPSNMHSIVNRLLMIFITQIGLFTLVLTGVTARIVLDRGSVLYSALAYLHL